MKKLILFTYLFTLTLASLAAPKIKVSKDKGTWGTNTTWNLNRLPATGDTVEVPAGITLVIDDNQNLSSSTIHLRVYGTLSFSRPGSKLTLSEESTVIIYSGGMLTGTGSPSEVLALGSNTVFKGNQSTVYGPQYATSSSSGFDYYAENQPLPVRFIGFTATRRNSDVLLQWSTAEEVNAAHFDLERSFDGTSWSRVARLAAAGDTRSVSHYSHTDKNILARAVYYRVRQVDADGRFTYTTVRLVRQAADAAIGIAATGSRLLLQFPEEVKGAVVVSVTALNGQLVARHTLKGALGQQVLQAPAALRGVYVVTVSNGQALQAARQVIF